MIVAVDCDLERIHALDEAGGIRCYNCPHPAEAVERIFASPVDKVIYEVASPVEYHGDHQSTRLWMMFNMWSLGVFSVLSPAPLHVAPSSAWTKAFKEKERQLMAGCAQKNHDLRECEAMLWFHGKDPGVWRPVETYFKELRNGLRSKSKSNGRRRARSGR